MAEEAGGRRFNLETPGLATAALIVAAGFLGSRLLGLVRSVIIAGRFGTSPELDAYWVAFRLPDLVFQLLAGATLASAFIPAFAATRARDGEAAAWRLASSVLNLVLLATAVFAALAFVLAPVLVPAMAPGLGAEAGREEELRSLAVDLTRIMLVSPLLFAVSGMVMGILNARRHFLTPALAPMTYNLAIIGAALVSRDVEALAIGVVVGAALHLAVQLPDLRFAGMVYRFVAGWSDRAVQEVASRMGPRVLGLAAAQVNFYFIAIFFASRLEAGAISALTFAWLIAMTPLGVIGMAISTAAFPTLAEQAARADRAFSETMLRTLRLIAFLSLPVGVGLMVLARPAVVVLLERGAFGGAATDLTSQALLFYAAALFGHSGIEILSRGYYAFGDTRTPVALAIAGMLLNLALAAALVGPLELRGLALAQAVAASLECALLYAVLRRRMPELSGAAVLGPLARIAAAAALTGGAVLVTRLALTEAAGLSTARGLEALAVLAVCGVAGFVVYAAATMAAGLDEPRLLLARLGSMIGRARPAGA